MHDALTRHPQGYANILTVSVSLSALFRGASQHVKETYFRDNLVSTHFHAFEIAYTLWVWKGL